jgi:hypothetical protein
MLVVSLDGPLATGQQYLDGDSSTNEDPRRVSSAKALTLEIFKMLIV